MDKKNILTYEGLKKLEDELQNLKVVKRKEVAPVSYTHLDVYKRQIVVRSVGIFPDNTECVDCCKCG